MSKIRHALNTRRADDFAQWYQEVIAAADERNVAMIFTGTRHFRH